MSMALCCDLHRHQSDVVDAVASTTTQVQPPLCTPCHPVHSPSFAASLMTGTSYPPPLKQRQHMQCAHSSQHTLRQTYTAALTASHTTSLTAACTAAHNKQTRTHAHTQRRTCAPYARYCNSIQTFSGCSVSPMPPAVHTHSALLPLLP